MKLHLDQNDVNVLMLALEILIEAEGNLGESANTRLVGDAVRLRKTLRLGQRFKM